MKHFETLFQDFARLLDREEIWRDPSVRFRDICRGFRIRSRCFDRYLFRETGFRGEEILAVYRSNLHKKA